MISELVTCISITSEFSPLCTCDTFPPPLFGADDSKLFWTSDALTDTEDFSDSDGLPDIFADPSLSVFTGLSGGSDGSDKSFRL